MLSSAPAALLHILVLETEIFDVHRDAKVSQKSVCAYVNIYLKYTHNVCVQYGTPCLDKLVAV